MAADPHEVLRFLRENAEKRNEKHSAWLRQIVLGATGLAGVLLSLKSGKGDTSLQHSLYVSAVALLVLGIITGTMALYGGVDTLNKAERELMGKLARKETITDTYIPSRKIWRKLEVCTFWLLGVSLILLVVYAAAAGVT